jgi:hypothetical protein
MKLVHSGLSLFKYCQSGRTTVVLKGFRNKLPLSQWIQLRDRKSNRAILNKWFIDLGNLVNRCLLKTTPFSLKDERFTPPSGRLTGDLQKLKKEKFLNREPGHISSFSNIRTIILSNKRDTRYPYKIICSKENEDFFFTYYLFCINK